MRRKRKNGLVVREVEMPRAPEVSPSELIAERQRASATAYGLDRPTPCRVCGGAVEAEGAHYVGGWSEPGSIGTGSAVLGAWRQHPECHGDGARIASVILGEDVSPADVRGVPVPVFLHGHRADGEPVRAWSWITTEQREALDTAVTDNRVARTPLPNEDGRGCGWCGVAEALEWVADGSWTFADGGRALLCGTCWDAYDLAGHPSSYGEEWRWRLLRLAVGMKTTPMDDMGVRGYAEVATAPYDGTAEPFAYIPAETLWEARVHLLGRRPERAVDPEVGRAAATEWRRRVEKAEREAEKRRAEAQRQREADALRWA